MEVLFGAVVGAAVSMLSGVLFWFLNSKTARETQERQQGHDAKMQEQRLEAERTKRQEEALRAAKRERLQPLFDALAELDQLLGERLWAKMAQDGTLTKEQAEPILEFSADPARTSMKISALTFRIQHPSLVKELLQLGRKVMEPDMEWLAANAPRIYASFETYAATLDSQEGQP